MQSPNEVLDSSYPDARWMLIEVAAILDRFDRAAASDPASASHEDPRLQNLRELLDILRSDSPEADRAERMLKHLSDPLD